MARAGQAEAVTARDAALAAAASLWGRVDELQRSFAAARAEAETGDARARAAQERYVAAAARAEEAEQAASAAGKGRDAAAARAATAEATSTRCASEGDRLAFQAAEAGAHAVECERRMRSAQDELAQVRGTVGALRAAASDAVRRADAAEQAAERERAARAALETEVAGLRSELSRRPPLDTLAQLEIDTLLQRNMEAAAAMQALLAYAQRGDGVGVHRDVANARHYPPLSQQQPPPLTARTAGSATTSGGDEVTAGGARTRGASSVASDVPARAQSVTGDDTAAGGGPHAGTRRGSGGTS